MTMLPATREDAAVQLRQWRLEHGLSMRELGEMLGVTWLAVQRWEAGTYRVPPFLHLALRELERSLEPLDDGELTPFAADPVDYRPGRTS